MDRIEDTTKQKLRKIQKSQAVNNARRWLTLLHDEYDPGAFLNKNYENILRVLEILLIDPYEVSLTLTLMKAVSRTIFGYGDWERWSIYINKAIPYVETPEHDENRAFLFLQMGHIHYSNGKWEQAASFFQQAGALYQKLNIPAHYANALGYWGYMQSQRGQISEGIALCQQALVIATQVQAYEVMAEIQMNFANIYQNTHEWEKALVAAQTAHAYYEQHEIDINHRHNLLNLIITLSSKLGRWSEVAELAHEHMNLLEQAGEIRKLARIKMNLGVIFFERGEYNLAETLWYETLHLQSQIQEPRSLAILYNNLGHLYTKLGEWETAEKMLQDAIQTYASLGDVYFQADTLDNLAECYQLQEKWVACRQCLEEAITLLTQTDTSTPYYQKLLQKLKVSLAHLPTTDLQTVSS